MSVWGWIRLYREKIAMVVGAAVGIVACRAVLGMDPMLAIYVGGMAGIVSALALTWLWRRSERDEEPGSR